MKKFLVLSAIVGLAGIGIGVAGRGDSPSASIVASAPAESTASTTAVADVVSTSTTRPATKTAVKSTSTTTRTATPAIVAVTTTSTVGPSATTTTTAAPATTTTTIAAGPAPTCAISPEKASVASGEAQVLRLTSNLANTSVRITAVFPGDPLTVNKLPRQLVHQATTDGAGADTWTVSSPVRSEGLVRVSVNFYPAGAQQIGALCSTSYESTK